MPRIPFVRPALLGGLAAWVMGNHQERLWGRGWQSRVDVFEIVLGLLVATTAVAQVRRAPNVQVVSGLSTGPIPGQVTVALPDVDYAC